MKRRCLFLFLWFTLFVFAFWLGVWTAWTEEQAHYTPEYAKVNIVPILQKENLSDTDYELLFQQTGLNRLGVDGLRQKGQLNHILYLQERFFEEVEMVCLRDNFIVQSERLVNVETPERSFLPAAQTGDILISFSGHVFGWRNGHAAIVVDAEEGVTLEAITLGSDSRVCDIKKWAEYPCFALLRLKGATMEERAAIAVYAAENLVGVSYRLFSFSGDSKIADFLSLTNNSEVAGTHCSHLVWSAYAHFGFDLDADGGWIVTPRDIYDCELLEVVQVYGLEPVTAEVE